MERMDKNLSSRIEVCIWFPLPAAEFKTSYHRNSVKVSPKLVKKLSSGDFLLR
jgi:hypothetical protein